MTKVIVETKHPVAFDSPDHLYPHGTAQNNSTNDRFTKKIFDYFGKRLPFNEIKILDLGCAGGGFIRSCLNTGALAVGIEGSDFSKKRARAEWAYLADKFLFTADITYPYQIYEMHGDGKTKILFDLITSWEVFEHLPEDRIDAAIINIKEHLKPTGLAILSISLREEIVRGNALHLCVKPKQWWIEKFESHQFINQSGFEKYFNTQYIRGPKQQARESFHLIVSLNPVGKIPKLSLKNKIMDRWVGSTMHRKMKNFIS